MSSRPVPTSYGVVPGSSFADDISASLSRRGDHAGCAAARIAAAPATWGVAIEVPSIVWYMPSPHAICCDRAAVTSTPGAEMSGLSAWSPERGPMLENHARWSSAVDGGHRQRLVGGAGGADRELRAVVPGGDHEERARVARSAR